MPNKLKAGQKRSERRKVQAEKEAANPPIRDPNNRLCGCEASQHGLINNCLNCGRIVCTYEGSGPCLTCGDLVCTDEEKEIIRQGGKGSVKLEEKLKFEVSLKDITKILQRDSEYNEELDKAIKLKELMLDYDVSSERLTKVTDDQADYFEIDHMKWITPEQREKLRQLEKERHEAKYGHKSSYEVTLDIDGRQILEQAPTLPCIDVDKILKEDVSIYESKKNVTDTDDFENFKPKYCSNLTVSESHWVADPERQRLRIQDRELKYMVDEGMCLSVQQPYASLIVAGLKPHEGRSWSTTHRGVLWIHAGAHVPDDTEMDRIREFHLRIGVKEADYPKKFDYGCIVGCVHLFDCLNQEEYREQFPDGACGDTYAFILESPKKLYMALPVVGNRRIFQLPKEFHDGAKNLAKLSQ